MWFSSLNSRYSGIFAGFLPVKTSNMNRFRNGFHCWIAFSKLYNNAAHSFSRHKLRCMKIIIETFYGRIGFRALARLFSKQNQFGFHEIFLLVKPNNLTPRTTFQVENWLNWKIAFPGRPETVFRKDFFLKIAITNPFFVRFQTDCRVL